MCTSVNGMFRERVMWREGGFFFISRACWFDSEADDELLIHYLGTRGTSWGWINRYLINGRIRFLSCTYLYFVEWYDSVFLIILYAIYY